MAKLSKEGLKISYRPLTALQCKYILESLAEGLVQANMVEMDSGLPSFDSLEAEGIVYEEPQRDCNGDQEVGLLSEILHKGRATCLEAATIAAAAERRAGNTATVEVEFEKDSYNQIIPWSYHAYTRINGELFDPSAALKRPSVGACCSSCATGKPCESTCSDHDHDHHHHDEPAVGKHSTRLRDLLLVQKGR